MGKSQKKRRTHRHNPLETPVLGERHDQTSASSDESSKNVATLMSKLQSTETQERVWACASISNIIISDPSARRAAFSGKYVSVLVKLLSDINHTVVAEAAGVLRNLCVEGGQDATLDLCKPEVFSSLKSTSAQISKSLDHYAKQQPLPPIDGMLAHFAENIITVIWCLSETSEDAISALSEPDLVHLLMNILLWNDRLPVGLVAAACHCLYLFSDDDDAIAKTLRNTTTYVFALINLANISTGNPQEADPRKLSVQILSCGILRNIAPLPSVVPLDLERGLLLPKLTPCLPSSLLDLSDAISVQVEQTVQPESPGTDGGKSPQLQERLESIELQLANIQLALEILTGICGDPLAAVESRDGDDVEMSVDENNANPSIPERPVPTSLGLSTALIALSRPVSLQTIHQVAHRDKLSAMFFNINLRSLQCLSNLYLGLSASSEADLEAHADNLESYKAIWTSLWNVLSTTEREREAGHERQLELWETGVGALWGVARLCTGKLDVKESDILSLQNLYAATKNGDTKVKCIGIIGCLAQGSSIQVNKTASHSLFTAITENSMKTCPEAAIEAMSAIIDVFSDEQKPYDLNFTTEGRLRQLVVTLPAFKGVVKSIDKRTPGSRDARMRGEEVLMNLTAFIDYRKTVSQ